jgi:nucleotide-binding universal stress UspA family protein
MTIRTFPPRRVLVPTDLSGTSVPAINFARVMHDQFGAAVAVLHAHHFDLPPYFSGAQIENLKRELKQSTRLATEYLRRESQSSLGFEAEISVVEATPAEAILEGSRAADVDLIIMGTHGRQGVSRFWLGSVAERILHESSKPVLLVRQGMPAAFFERIMCPVSFSGAGQAALEYAAAIADAGKLRLTVLHSVEKGDQPPDCALVPEAVRGRCTLEELIYQGDAAGSILRAAQEIKPDLIIMGAERRPSMFGKLFSGTTEQIMQGGEVPLLIVPRPETQRI